jgi:hypothetical protein
MQITPIKIAIAASATAATAAFVPYDINAAHHPEEFRDLGAVIYSGVGVAGGVALAGVTGLLSISGHLRPVTGPIAGVGLGIAAGAAAGLGALAIINRLEGDART